MGDNNFLGLKYLRKIKKKSRVQTQYPNLIPKFFLGLTNSEFSSKHFGVEIKKNYLI